MFLWAGLTLVIMLPLAFTLKDRPEDAGLLPDGDGLGEAASVKTESTVPAAVAPSLSVSQAVRTRPFWLLSVGHFLCGAGCGLIMTHIVIFATDAGYSELVGASLLSVIGAVNVAGVLATGLLSDRMSKPGVLALTHLVRTVSFGVVVAFIMLGERSLWMLYAAMALFGFGWFTTAPLVAGLVTGIFGPARAGTILGVVTSGHFLGMAVGAYAGGLVFEATGNYLLVFAVLAGLSLAATLLSLAIKHPAAKSSPLEVANGRTANCC